jgi:tetratricopeptide (TPR) repeat protein
MPPARRLAIVAAALLLSIPALLVFVPGLDYGYLNIDDVHNIPDNPALRDLSWKGIRYLFLEDRTDVRYFPFTYLSLAVDYHFHEVQPYYVHLGNLVLHLANSAMVAALVFALFRDGLVAMLTALVFSIHPLQIESVTWAISRKNVLFLFFFLASALVYVASASRLATRRVLALLGLVASALLYLVACLSKTAAITLPAALVVVDYARDPDARCDLLGFLRRSLPTKLVYVPVAVFVVVVTRRYQTENPFQRDYGYSPFEALLIVGHNLFFYVWKTFAAVRFAVFYALPQPGTFPPHFYVYAAGAVALLALTAWAFWRDRRVLFVGLAWYLVTIAPMAVLVLYFSDFPLLSADRYVYQSLPGIVLGPAAAAALLWRRQRELRPLLLGVVVLVVVALCVSASTHREAFRSDLYLFEELFEHDPSDEFAYRLAVEYAYAGRMEDAFRVLDAAEHLPSQMFFMNFFGNRVRLADLYRRKGDLAKAAMQLESGIEFTPNPYEQHDARTPLAYHVIADLLERAGDAAGAARAREKAAVAKEDPERFFETRWISASPLEAKRFLTARLAADPKDPMNWYYYGLLAQLVGDTHTAMESLERARALGYRPLRSATSRGAYK